MYKVQLTFTSQEAEILNQKAALIGYNLTKYIKLLLGKEVLDVVGNYPTYRLSSKAIKQVNDSYKEYKNGFATKLENINDLDST